MDCKHSQEANDKDMAAMSVVLTMGANEKYFVK